mgnify:CR=1 FL=1
MAKERKKRQERKVTVDTSQLKSYGSDFKSRGQQRLAFSKRVKEEADKVQQQIQEEQEKAKEKSLWSSIGGALGGLALGLATGGLGWVAAGVGTGLGTYGGAQAGKALSESKSGKRKTIKSDMFYESEAEKQNLAFRDFDEKLDEGILNRSLAAGVMAAAFTGGGDLIKSLKEKKNLKDAAVTAQQIETGAKVKKAAEGADFVMKANVPTDTLDLVQARTNELGAISEGLDMGMDLSTLKVIPEPSSSALALKESSSMSSSFANSLTPITEQAAPSIMDSYFKGLAQQKSKSMQQGLMFAGASSLYGYRPELQSLRQIQFGNKIKPYG